MRGTAALRQHGAQVDGGADAILAGGVNFADMGQFGQGGAGGGGGQRRVVAVAAEVKLDDMPQSARRRTPQHCLKQGRRLIVGEVALVAENAGDQSRRSTAGAFHADVVIELQGQQVHLAQRLDQRLVPAAQVGDVTGGAGVAEQVVAALDAKAERVAAIMADRQRPTAQSPVPG